MSDPDRAPESAASEHVRAEREDVASVAPESGLRTESDAEVPRRRSSIRPVPPDWQPPPRSDPPPRPMVVVYAGDSQAPIDWDVPASQTPNTARATPAELFVIPRDVPPPALEHFEALAPPLDEAGPGVAHAPTEGEPERVNIFDGRPISSLTPQEVEALVAYELARDRFRAELETPAAPRARAVEPPAPVVVERGPVVAQPSSTPSSPPSSASELGVWPLVGGGLLLGVALATALSVASSGAPALDAANAASSPSPTREAVQAVQAVQAVDSLGPLASHANPSNLTSESAARAAPSPSAVASAASAGGLDPKRRSTKVVLQVFPVDAKVSVRGARKRGPPYEFDVPRNRRVVLEVSRKGYVARKVVLDGSEASLTIGLSKEQTSSVSAAGGSEPRIGVRSGL